MDSYLNKIEDLSKDVGAVIEFNKVVMSEWNEYSKMVLHELKRLNDGLEKLEEGQRLIEKDIIKLQTKATLWGSIGGFIIALLTNVLFFLIKK